MGRWSFRFRDVSRIAGRLGSSGDAVRFGRPTRHDGVAVATDLDQAALSKTGTAAPTQTVAQHSQALGAEAWREITVAEGSQGPRTYRYSAQRVWVTQRRKPGEILWVIYRQNLDGSEPPLLSIQRSRGHAPGNPGLRGWLQMAH